MMTSAARSGKKTDRGSAMSLPVATAAQLLPHDCCLRALLQSHHVGLLASIQPAEGGMPMNSRHTISLSEFSRSQWADEPPEPPPHPTEPNLVARLRSWLSKLSSHTRVRSSLAELAPRVRSWLGEPATLARVWSSLTELDPLTFARYLIAFFIGVVATVAWQSYVSGTKEGTVAATPAALDSVRQSVDKLAAEIAKIKTVEQEILERISASPPPPVATPARNPAQRTPPVR
jgi:hypothetical protein